MTWEETIKFIRTKPEFKELVEKAYFDEDLVVNIERFKASEEYKETLTILGRYAPGGKTILDVGSGNGISAVCFALDGFDVTSSEPDPSLTIGAGAILWLKNYYKLPNLEVYEAFAEEIPISDQLFDVVYVRQAMHHAYNLKQFIHNITTLLKPNGLLLTIRDHVIYNENDKQWFLESHPLHKFYGGENAFTIKEYKEAMEQAGLQVREILGYYDSVVNYFPLTRTDLEQMKSDAKHQLISRLASKIGPLSRLPFLQKLFASLIDLDHKIFDESKTPGRMYSFIAVKSE